ncbi:hypothetical protein P4310_18725 [Bacillus thuringiensis]|uniref:hypothetical protein n=1 Tax=Bacillus thuringiensis TaxID=1428 RepID=UPI000A3C4CE1|nr:hypothetical protein [Bacillus thuringiensis]MDY8164691.1 hypothetical protein [Bacillus thuringiensis]MED3067546.1 hypothetical protein [Bacillus thuringiensis]OUB30693.1 hypothetical protein BK737_17425 [Bacillus thuringiensis serovar palmanyolensis]
MNKDQLDKHIPEFKTDSIHIQNININEHKGLIIISVKHDSKLEKLFSLDNLLTTIEDNTRYILLFYSLKDEIPNCQALISNEILGTGKATKCKILKITGCVDKTYDPKTCISFCDFINDLKAKCYCDWAGEWTPTPDECE